MNPEKREKIEKAAEREAVGDICQSPGRRAARTS
jgi:hypothetical protein